MSRVLTIAGREVRSLFLSPIGYVVVAVYVGLISVLWWLLTQGQYAQGASYRGIAYNMHIFLLFVLPAVTMRALAEERRTRTLEVLVTQPVRDVEIVLGKWLACMALVAIMLVGTMHFWAQMHWWTEGSLDDGPVMVAYLGLFLAGMLYTSIGVFFSSITENQIVAALLTFVMIIVVYFVKFIADNQSGFWQDVLNQASTLYHFEDFARGVLDTKHAVYYVLGSVGFLFMAVRSLESRSWG